MEQTANVDAQIDVQIVKVFASAAIRAVKEQPATESRPIVIAHELTPHTRVALQSGLIDAVLNQDAGHEVRSAIRVLKARADGIDVIDGQERIRIDIFLKDNLP